MKLGYWKMVSLICFEIIARHHDRVLYSFLGSMVFHFEEKGLKRMSMNLKSSVDILSPTCLEIDARAHARVLYSCPRLMVVNFKELRLNINLENVVKLGRPTFLKLSLGLLHGFYTLF